MRRCIVNARQDFSALQRAYDNRQPADDWQPESHEMVTCEEAIDHLRSAIRSFGNNKDAAAKGSIQDAILMLMENDSIAAVLRSMDLSEKVS